MARWLGTLCMALILALAAVSQPGEAAAMTMSAAALGEVAQCDDCPDGGEACAVACLMAWPALAPVMTAPATVTSVGFAPRRPDVLAGSAGPPDPQPPRFPARG